MTHSRVTATFGFCSEVCEVSRLSGTGVCVDVLPAVLWGIVMSAPAGAGPEGPPSQPVSSSHFELDRMRPIKGKPACRPLSGF